MQLKKPQIIQFVCSLMLLVPFKLSAQQKDTLIKKLDSLNTQPADLKRKTTDSINQANYNAVTKLNVRSYFILLASDIKQQVTAPFHTKAKDWAKVGYFGLLTGAVMLADEPVNRFTVDLVNKNNSIASVSKYVTKFGGIYEVYTLAALGSYGFIFKNEKIKTTTLLASQAYITAGLIESVLKFLTGRQRPVYYDPVTNENEAAWHGPFYQFKKDNLGKRPDGGSYSAFPSGHTTAAFAAATIFAIEYRDRPLVPIIAYSAASLIGLSRITENKHWASDVLVGAALGYLCGRQVAKNYHRYAAIKSGAAKTKNTVSFNLSYQNGVLLPGIIYKVK